MCTVLMKEQNLTPVVVVVVVVVVVAVAVAVAVGVVVVIIVVVVVVLFFCTSTVLDDTRNDTKSHLPEADQSGKQKYCKLWY